MPGYNLYAVHARGLSMFQNKQGENCPTFLWNRGNPIAFDGTDSSWVISPSTAIEKNPLTSGGFGSEFSLRFTALAAQFFTPPTLTTVDQLRQQMMETPMGYLGGYYKIKTVELSPDGLVLIIEANAENQNA